MKYGLLIVTVFAIAAYTILIAFDHEAGETISEQSVNQAIPAPEDHDQPAVTEKATVSFGRVPAKSGAINEVRGTALPPENFGEAIQRIQAVQRRVQHEYPVAPSQQYSSSHAQPMPSLVEAVNATRPSSVDDHRPISSNPFHAN